MSAWRTVRVFISSTFRDMHAERDWLVQRVFPALRERLEPHRIHLVDIDLRWGVTKEQADNEEVIDICLSQIDACRPFFLGILGERYGWVPDRVPERVTSNNKWAWVQAAMGKSITEFEVLYGVLNNPAMHGHALFCFRDPAFAANVPAARRGDMEPESPTHLEKLKTLKQAIRDSKLPLLETYPCRYAGLRVNPNLIAADLNEDERTMLSRVAADRLVQPAEMQGLTPRLRELIEQQGTIHLEGLEEFGNRIQAWLWESIKREEKLPDEAPSGTAVAVDPLAEEQSFHERFMESRLRVYVGRESLQTKLFGFADGSDATPCLVTGASGSGKSAAMAKFIQVYANDHRSTLMISHFVGASPASTSLRSLLHRFCSVLKATFAFTEDVPADTNSLISTFRQFIEKIPAERHVVLAIDALNQLDEADNAQRLSWLPWKFPAHVKLVVSCIADPGREEQVLQAFANRPHQAIAIEPLTADERSTILKAVPSLSAKTLDPRQVSMLLENPATTNPLFLLVALEELRGFGSYEQLNRRIETLPREGETVTTLFDQVMERLEGEFNPEVVRSMLSLLACARRGLSDRELLDVIEGSGVATQQSASDLFPVLRQLRSYLQHRGRLWDFFHRNLDKAVRARYLKDETTKSDAHARLAEYFKGQEYFMESLEEQRARAKRLPPTPRPANVRKVDELPFQLLQVAKLVGKDDAKSPHWGAIADLFTDLHFLEAKAEAVA